MYNLFILMAGMDQAVRLARNSSKEAAAVMSPGRLFHSRIVRGEKEL